MEDYDDDYDLECKHCGSSPIRSNECDKCGGEGYLDDLHESEPLWYEPGQVETCNECKGVGFLHWCPKCGKDYEFEKEEVEDDH